MRIGQDNLIIRDAGSAQASLYPQCITGKYKGLYNHDVSPWHAELGHFFTAAMSGTNPDDWAAYSTGSPQNNNAYGGHSDAADWDRHLGHISNIYDMLLPYILTDGRLNDDNLRIAESGNGIPDILDEARNEVDFWLRFARWRRIQSRTYQPQRQQCPLPGGKHADSGMGKRRQRIHAGQLFYARRIE